MIRRTFALALVSAATVAAATDHAEGRSTDCRSKACKRRTCLSDACHRRVAAKIRARRPQGYASSITAPYRAWLNRVAMCESTNNPRAVSRNGVYRGLFQFDLQTWASVGGSGDPINATRSEQELRAVLLLKRRGTSPWPVCG